MLLFLCSLISFTRFDSSRAKMAPPMRIFTKKKKKKNAIYLLTIWSHLFNQNFCSSTFQVKSAIFIQLSVLRFFCDWEETVHVYRIFQILRVYFSILHVFHVRIENCKKFSFRIFGLWIKIFELWIGTFRIMDFYELLSFCFENFATNHSYYFRLLN